MVKVGLLARLEAKAGKEKEVDAFLRGGLAVVEAKPATVTWFAIRGGVAKALMAKADEFLARPPVIERVDVLAMKLPGTSGGGSAAGR